MSRNGGVLGEKIGVTLSGASGIWGLYSIFLNRKVMFLFLSV